MNYSFKDLQIFLLNMEQDVKELRKLNLLKKIAKDNGIENYSQMSKSELVEKIKKIPGFIGGIKNKRKIRKEKIQEQEQEQIKKTTKNK